MKTINFDYSDDFDAEHYPISESHHETIEKIVYDVLKLPAPIAEKSIRYRATIHGRVFTIQTFPRIHAPEMKQLTELENVRWIGFDSGELSIGLTH